MQVIIDYARAEGLKTVEGQVLTENAEMLNMCRELGFRIAADPNEPDICVVTLPVEH
jgi:acetyltransferase